MASEKNNAQHPAPALASRTKAGSNSFTVVAVRNQDQPVF